MKQDWQEGIRRAYCESSVQPAGDVHAVARLAITRGRQLVNARALARASLVGMVVSSLVLVSAYLWADIEADRTTEVLVSKEVSWML